MPKVFTSDTQKIGEIGENVAVKFLEKHNFAILERNYTKKWGEIDIVAKKDDKIYFIEVKSLSIESFEDVNRETNGEYYRPEENMHPWKLKRMARAIQTYLFSRNLDEKEWQVDLLVIYLNLKDKIARVKVIKDIVL